MQWKRIDDYHISNNEFTITKCVVGEDIKYVLWRKSKLIDVFDVSEEAKQFCANTCQIISKSL